MDITAILIEMVTGPEVIALVALMAANVILSIIAAIKNHEFSFRNLGDFIPHRLMPMLSYLVLAVLARYVPEWVAAAVTVYAGLIAMYGAGIAAAVKSITGVNIPDSFTERRP